jgi:hypothetical protein
MGADMIKLAIGEKYPPLEYKLEHGFYVFDDGFYPVKIAEESKRSDGKHRYRWKYGEKHGELVYDWANPRTIFADALQAAGFPDAVDHLLLSGVIARGNGTRQPILVHAHRDIEELDWELEFVDKGFLQPVQTMRLRGLYPDPQNGAKNTHKKSSVTYKGKSYGDITYPASASNADVFKLALWKIGYRSMRDRRFKKGVISVFRTNLPKGSMIETNTEHHFIAYTA